MARDDVADASLVRIDDEVGERREGRLDRPLDELVEPGDNGVRVVVLEGERAERVPELAHHRRRLDTLADHVADDEGDAAVVEMDDVVPVAADVDTDRAGQVAGGEGDAADRREPLGQDAPLHGLGDRAFGLVAPGPVERLPALAHERDEPFAVGVGERTGSTISARRARRSRSRASSSRRRSSPAVRSASQIAIGAAAAAGISSSDASSPIEATTDSVPASGVAVGAPQDHQSFGGADAHDGVLETRAAHVLERDRLRQSRGDGLKLEQPPRGLPLALEQLGPIECLGGLSREADDEAQVTLNRRGSPEPTTMPPIGRPAAINGAATRDSPLRASAG